MKSQSPHISPCQADFFLPRFRKSTQTGAALILAVLGHLTSIPCVPFYKHSQIFPSPRFLNCDGAALDDGNEICLGCYLVAMGLQCPCAIYGFPRGLPLRLPAPCPSDLVSGHDTWQQSCCPANQTFVKEESAICCPDGQRKIRETYYLKS